MPIKAEFIEQNRTERHSKHKTEKKTLNIQKRSTALERSVKKKLYAFLRRPLNEHVIQFLCLYLHMKYHFVACKLCSRELAGSRALVPACICYMHCIIISKELIEPDYHVIGHVI